VNRFFCWLTGGHRYAHSNQIAENSPDSNDVWISNHCIKCGARYFVRLDTDRIIQKITKRSDKK
jgi:hypothetical protein